MSTATKRRLSGFCTPGNPRTSAYDPHQQCRPRTGGCDCDAAGCPCAPVAVAVRDIPTALIVTAADPDTPAWFEARRGGITGTDLPKILGLSKYGNALSVWLDKRDELDDDGVGEAARWGHLLEDPVAQEWATRVGTSVERVGVLAHVEHDWMRASLDRTVVACPDGDGTCGLEIKTRSAFKAADWRDGIPDDVLAQVAWGRLVSGFDHMHVAALIGGQRLTAFRYDPDETLETYLLAAARPVWQAVVDGAPPEAHPDSEGVLLELLDRLYSRRAGDVDLDPDAAGQWLEQYAAGGDLEREAKRLKTQAKTALVQMLGDGDTGLIDDAPAFTYRRPESGYTVPADAVRRLRTERPETWAALLDDAYITETDPAPRFAIKKRATTTGAAA